MEVVHSIQKIATRPDGFRRTCLPFESARAAFRHWLNSLNLASDEAVLLPAYVGWSAREGSGVFDPIRELGLACEFYRVDRRLHVDVDDVSRLLATRRIRALVLIHYFGLPDPNAIELARRARERGVVVLEDEAHSMLTNLIGGSSGFLGDASVFSLHKLLPTQSGGLLVGARVQPTVARSEPVPGLLPWDFDLAAVAAARRQNAAAVLARLPAISEDFDSLWNALPPGVVPQTVPVVVNRVSRDDLYFAMNAAGYGVVSLYHTLIDEIDKERFVDAHWLSRRVLNLPVHQDATTADIAAMMNELEKQVAALRTAGSAP
jgi:dTDP-4-amino-4,6-dideoxygalactose transaminase